MSNPFASWTKDDVDRFNEKVAHVVQSKLQSGVKNERIIETAKAIRRLDPMRPKNPKKPLMNKLETAWFNELKARGQQTILCQAITLKLGEDLRYTPDFFVIGGVGSACGLSVEAHEVKGPFEREDARVKRLAAVTQYPWIRFFLIKRDPKTKAWIEKVMS